MRGFVRKSLLTGISGTVLMLGLPACPAGADPGDLIVGHCSVASDSNPTVTQDENQGAIEVTAVMLTSSHGPDGSGEIGCKIQVNGSDAAGVELDARANATGVVQGSLQIVWDDQGGALPSALCENDTWGDGDTTGWVCKPFVPTHDPVPQVIGLIDGVIATVFSSVICPTLEQLHLGHCT